LNWADYRDAVTGSTRLKLPQNTMNLVLLPAPPIDEQISITERLNSAFFAISYARKATDSQSADVNSLNGLILSAGFSFDAVFPTEKGFLTLGDHCRKIGSGSTPSGGHKSYVKNGVPLIRSQNVLMRAFGREDLHVLLPRSMQT